MPLAVLAMAFTTFLVVANIIATQDRLSGRLGGVGQLYRVPR